MRSVRPGKISFILFFCMACVPLALAQISIFSGCDTMKRNNYCFTFAEENTPLDNDTIGLTYEWDFGDGTKSKGIQVDHCFRCPGNYLVQLNMIENKTGVVFYNKASYDFTVEGLQQLCIDGPDTVMLGRTFTCSMAGLSLPGYTIKDYTWGLDGHETGKGKSCNYNFTEEGERGIMLSVSAQNDSDRSMKSFCTKKFVTVLTEEKFKNIHSRTNILTDDPDNKNESPLFIFYGSQVLKAVVVKGVYRYTFADLGKLIRSIPYYNHDLVTGIDTMLYGFDLDLKKKLEKNNGSVEGYSVFFGKGKYLLSDEQRNGLDSLVVEMKKKTDLLADVIAYTDKSGSPVLNAKLSGQRAYTIKSYLVSKGISAKRIKTISYGSALLKNSDETEETKKISRRADIILHQ